MQALERNKYGFKTYSFDVDRDHKIFFHDTGNNSIEIELKEPNWLNWKGVFSKHSAGTLEDAFFPAMDAYYEYYTEKGHEVNIQQLISIFQRNFFYYGRHLITTRSDKYVVIDSAGWYILEYEQVPKQYSINDDFSKIKPDEFRKSRIFFFKAKLIDTLEPIKDYEGNSYNLLWISPPQTPIHENAIYKTIALCQVGPQPYRSGFGLLDFIPLDFEG